MMMIIIILKNDLNIYIKLMQLKFYFKLNYILKIIHCIIQGEKIFLSVDYF